MDKIQAKAEIDRIKQKLAQLKGQHKSNNDNHKYQLDGLKKSASIQTTPAAYFNNSQHAMYLFYYQNILDIHLSQA